MALNLQALKAKFAGKAIDKANASLGRGYHTQRPPKEPITRLDTAQQDEREYRSELAARLKAGQATLKQRLVNAQYARDASKVGLAAGATFSDLDSRTKAAIAADAKKPLFPGANKNPLAQAPYSEWPRKMAQPRAQFSTPVKAARPAVFSGKPLRPPLKAFGVSYYA